MHQSPVHFPPDYYRVSPVRGQLEAYDPSSPRNWRYIQTTDTPNELRVSHSPRQILRPAYARRATGTFTACSIVPVRAAAEA